MKVVPYRRAWGNVKMRGRKQCGLSCLCCVIFNNKEKQLEDQIDKENIQEFDYKSRWFNDLIRYELMSEQDHEDATYSSYWHDYKQAA